jgi:predicted kinase
MNDINKSLSRELIVMIGMSFSGKSYYVDNNYLKTHQLISSKHIKQALKTTKMSNPDLVYVTMDLISRSHMIKGLPIIVDESNTTVESLFLWKTITREFGYSLKGVLIDTPLSVCVSRVKDVLNGEEISEEMHKKLVEEYEKVEELKSILKMKHQSVVDQVVFITYDGG